MADERLGILDRIKAFIGASACLFAGWFTLWGPEEILDEIREEISDKARVRIGIAFLAFGAVFGLAALFASGRSARSQAIAAHFKGLLLAGIMGLLLWLLGLTAGADAVMAWKLKDGAGQPARAEVLRRHAVQVKRTTSYSYTIRYAGHRKRIRLPDSARGSKTVGVLYLPDDPDVVLPGAKGDGFVALLDKNHGPWGKWGIAGVALALVLAFLFGVKRFLFGKSRPPSD